MRQGANTYSKPDFIEEMGLALEHSGLPRMVGRVLGALLVAEPSEQSAEALMKALRASRGSISSSTRILIQTGLIERVSKPGERRDYFRTRAGAWAEITRARMASLSLFRRLGEKGLTVLEGGDPELRRGLEEMRDFYAYWEREFPSLFERWEEELRRQVKGKREV